MPLLEHSFCRGERPQVSHRVRKICTYCRSRVFVAYNRRCLWVFRPSKYAHTGCVGRYHIKRKIVC
jgi:hypothetical protein